MSGYVPEPDLYTPDLDASPLDREVMLLAGVLHRSGWPETAERMASAMAYVREASGEHRIGDATPAHLADALDELAENAEALRYLVARYGPKVRP